MNVKKIEKSFKNLSILTGKFERTNTELCEVLDTLNINYQEMGEHFGKLDYCFQEFLKGKTKNLIIPEELKAVALEIKSEFFIETLADVIRYCELLRQRTKDLVKEFGNNPLFK